jgi:hypothetical protein
MQGDISTGRHEHMAYLDRYLAGECEPVWDELFTLGPAVFDEPLYDDVIAVVRETMRRVRANIEQLILRLDRIGFIFGYDHLIQQTLPQPSNGGKWQNYLETRRWSYEQPPVLLPAQLQEELRLEIRGLGLADVEEDILDGTDTIPDMKANISKLDQQIGPLPLALRVWYEQVGAVNFYGYHSGWLKYVQFPTHLMNYCDPLQVYVLDTSLVNHLLEKHRPTPMKHFEFASDENFKDNRSGSGTPYDIQWHEAGIDGMLPSSNLTFVKYLRTCFQWAGFPGMANWPEVPVDDLAILTEGLLPF